MSQKIINRDRSFADQDSMKVLVFCRVNYFSMLCSLVSMTMSSSFAQILPLPSIPDMSAPTSCKMAPLQPTPDAAPLACPDLLREHQLEQKLHEQTFGREKDKNQDTEIRDKWLAQEEVTYKAAKTCLAQRFSHCYPNLQQSISKADLEKMFTTFKSDYRLRYSSGGGGACHLRAGALAYLLAQAGYAAQVVRIEHSPTLIAMDRALDDKLTGRYDDYQGYHNVIQVMVTEGDAQVPYLLDPQYMTKPMPRDEYFIKTTGQVCHRIDSPQSKSFLNCSYRLQPQNSPSEDVHAVFVLDPKNHFTTCGWENDALHEEYAKMSAKEMPPVSGLILTNGGNSQAPAELRNRPVTETTYKALILNAYKNYGTTLAELQKYSELKIGPTAEEKRQTKKQIESDYANLNAKIHEVEKNLAARDEELSN